MSRQSTIASYTVREIPDIAHSGWDGWPRASPGGGHLLQSYAWGDFKRRFGRKPVRLVLERDGEVAGVGQFLAYSTMPVPGLLMYCSKGPGCPGGTRRPSEPSFQGRPPGPERRGRTLKIELEVLEGRNDVKAC